MASYAFRIRGIEPAHDPAWRSASPDLRRAFWRAVVELGLQAKDRDLAQGLDKDGVPMKGIAASTRKYRRSAMGPADPSAPPLTPAYGLSRTRSLLTGRAMTDHAEFFWRNHGGQHWGKVLGYHAKGPGVGALEAPEGGHRGPRQPRPARRAGGGVPGLAEDAAAQDQGRRPGRLL